MFIQKRQSTTAPTLISAEVITELHAFSVSFHLVFEIETDVSTWLSPSCSPLGLTPFVLEYQVL